MRLVGRGGALRLSLGYSANRRISEARPDRSSRSSGAVLEAARARAGCAGRQIGHDGGRVAEHGMTARVPVLDVEDRVPLDAPSTFARSKSSGASFLRKSIMKRTASGPTSSTTSRRVTKSPDRFDIFTGSPARRSLTSWTIFTSRRPCRR